MGYRALVIPLGSSVSVPEGNAQLLQSFPAGMASPMASSALAGWRLGTGCWNHSPDQPPALASPNDAVGVYGQGGAGDFIGAGGRTGSSPGVVGTGGGANGAGVAGNGVRRRA